MTRYVKTDGTNLLGFKDFDNAGNHLSRAAKTVAYNDKRLFVVDEF